MTTLQTQKSPARPEPSPASPPRTGSIRRHVTEEEICVLTFDRPDSSANIFDRNTLEELKKHLEVIATSPNLKGLILATAKPSIFIAGADISAFSKTTRPGELSDLIELGQTLFNRISALSIPSVAAIHGACVGGGYEICLACDARIASPDKTTKIGLPETMLGILPAWGGSTRLPRLIGVPKALDIILAGKTLAAKPALKCGMIDDIVPREYLVEKAKQWILARDPGLRRRPGGFLKSLANTAIVARLIAWKVGKQLFKKTRGHYPAPLKALQVVTHGISRSIEESLALERDAVLELAGGEAARNLIRLFSLHERAKKISFGVPALAGPASGLTSDGSRKPSPEPAKTGTPNAKRIAVIGAGVMGSGIAHWVSSRDVSVILRDIHPDAVAKGLAGIAKLYDAGVKRHALTQTEARAGMDRIAPSATDVPLTGADIVIEAAVEKLDLKQQLFARLDELAGPDTILASNTSALSISEIAAATKHPGRVVGIHFFNPVHGMQLVEVIAGRQTSPDVVRRAVKFVQQIGKVPVVCRDSPGFLVNRILMPYLIEAGHLFERGARIEDIDECMLDFGMPMGPLRLLDEIGLDIASHVATDLASKFSDRMEAPVVLTRMIADGLLGKKNGRGFHLHSKDRGEPDVNPHIDTYHHDASCAGFSRDELQRRMVLLMVNEAARCIEEGVVAEPADADFGMILGTGFAPFLGGPLRFADFTGIRQLVGEMKGLAGKGELRFTPCKLLQTMAGTGREFYAP